MPNHRACFFRCRVLSVYDFYAVAIEVQDCGVEVTILLVANSGCAVRTATCIQSCCIEVADGDPAGR